MGLNDARRRHRPRLNALTAVVTGIVALGLALPTLATAQWTNPSLGASSVVSQTVFTGSTPTAVASGRNVTVSWTATTLSGGIAVDGYRLTRVNASTGVAATLTSCTGVITGLTCTETNVPPGTWRYRVTPVRAAWSGPIGTASAVVTVHDATLTFTSSTTMQTSELPKALTGTLANFAANEAVTYRLDGVTGPVLTGSPSTVGSTGSASFSVTIPAGTDNSPHNVYAVGATGEYALVPITVIDPPNLTALEMFDTNANGRIDRVVATFSRTLAPYTAGTAPWTLTAPPSGATLAGVTVAGSAATLALTEGTGTPTTAVGLFGVALAANAAGIRDVNGQTASFAATAPTDRAAPALTVQPSMNDTTANGKVDQVTMAFSETLATYSAGTTPWTLAGVPSNGTLSAASASGTSATLTITEGAGASDTSVGSFTVSLTSSATGIRDAAGNRTSMTGVVPLDNARPIATNRSAFDDDVDGRFDRVLASFSEPLAPYTAGVAGWTLAAAPSGTTLSSVTVPAGGSAATLTLTESTAPLTSVGSWTIALTATGGGIRDAAGNLSSAAAGSPTDRAAPVRVSATVQDLAGGDGIVDRVAVLFSETLATYSAGTSPWTLTNVPSGSTVTAASASTATVNLTLGSPTGAANTAVGSMTVAMASSAAGVRDAAGNVTAAFGASTPLDGAGEAPVTFATGVTGTTAGRAQAGDSLVVALSEPLAPSVTLPATTNVTLTDPSGTANDTITVPGLFSGARATGSNNYVTTDNVSASFTTSTFALSVDRRTITVTLGATCSGTGCSGLGTASAASAVVALDPSLVDAAGNLPTTVTRTFSIRLF